MAKKEKWAVWALDVSGNAGDGYEVKNRHRRGYVLASSSLRSIVKELVKNGVLKPSVRVSDITVASDRKGVLTIEEFPSHMPVVQMERE